MKSYYYIVIESESAKKSSEFSDAMFNLILSLAKHMQCNCLPDHKLGQGISLIIETQFPRLFGLTV